MKCLKMSKRFDAILKHLPEEYPQDWAWIAGVDRSIAVTVIDADVSTVSAAADKVLRIGDRDPWILHLEFQASRDATLGERVLQYNVLLRNRHSLPVRSIAILLRPQAQGRGATGRVDWSFPGGETYLAFQYTVMRLWEFSPETLLKGGIGTLPLLPLTHVARPDLPRLIREMSSRFQREAKHADVASLWTATYVLMGLEYEQAFAAQLLQGVRSMKESVTYQAILKEGRAEGLEKGLEEGLEKGLEKGREEEARRILLAQGTKRFGKPSTKIRKTIAAITEPVDFERLAVRLLDVESWTDLLAGSD